LLHEILGRLFVIVTGANPKIALAVWYSTDSDRTQQRMLSAAISALPDDRWPQRPRAREDLQWLLVRTNSLADQRNNAIHAPGALYCGSGVAGGMEIAPSFLQGHPRATRLMGKPLLDEFEWCKRCTEILTEFALAAETSLSVEQHPWPDRPKIPTRGRR